MNSGEILAEINAKTAEKSSLESLKAFLIEFADALSSLSVDYENAANLLVDALSFDGLPADKGKTAEYANSLKNASANFLDLADQIESEIGILTGETNDLRVAYKTALAREAAAREEAARKSAYETPTRRTTR